MVLVLAGLESEWHSGDAVSLIVKSFRNHVFANKSVAIRVTSVVQIKERYVNSRNHLYPQGENHG